MPIPDFQTLMRPLLQHLSDGADHSNQETASVLADQFHLSEDERTQLLPSGKQSVFTNRVAWAKSHLKQAGVEMAALMESLRKIASVWMSSTFRQSAGKVQLVGPKSRSSLEPFKGKGLARASS